MKDEHIVNRRKKRAFTEEERKLITAIKRKTQKDCRDNISRTKRYQRYYNKNPEIRWAYLASMVSRNAGWNMTDLKGRSYPRIFTRSYRTYLFYTYERANWMIFVDAYPQLLLYEESKKRGRPLFHLLRSFHVSVYMEMEWEAFWREPDEERLCTSLIINEQHVIQKPVIEHPVYEKKVFATVPFFLQEALHFSTVIFPTSEGRLYGFSVHGFRQVKERIWLGRRLAWLLFHSPEQKAISSFAERTVHTGRRYDYERYTVPKELAADTPLLRVGYPIIRHERAQVKDWYRRGMHLSSFYRQPDIPKPYDLTDWYQKKRKQLQTGARLFHQIFGWIK